MTLSEIEGTSPIEVAQDDFSQYEVYVRDSKGSEVQVSKAQFVFDSDGEPYIVLFTS